MSARPILIFGGSFDPPTTAHATLPPLAAEALDAQLLVYLPAAISPHKIDTPPTDAAHRLAMLHLIVDDIPRAVIDDRELHRDGPSFTVDTLEELAAYYDAPLRLLIGTDQARVFHRWHRWEDILRLAQPALMVRDDDDLDAVCADIAGHQGDPLARQWRAWVVDLPRLPQASTDARRRAFGGEPLTDDVPDAVERYIQAHGLYGSTGACTG